MGARPNWASQNLLSGSLLSICIWQLPWDPTLWHVWPGDWESHWMFKEKKKKKPLAMSHKQAVF